MTKIQRREIYWQMYCAAVGLAKMKAEEVWESYMYDDFSYDELPPGLCRMWGIICDNPFVSSDARIDLPELKLPKNLEVFKYDRGYWKPRVKLLLKAIALTYAAASPSIHVKKEDNETDKV